MIQMRVFGRPRPQPRPRKGKYGNIYQEKTDWFKLVYFNARQVRPAEPMTGPIIVGIEFVFPRPRSKKVETWHISTPDLDNLLKACMDAIVLARWISDDAPVSVAITSKRLAGDGEDSGATITVMDLAPDVLSTKKAILAYAGGLQ